MPGCHCHRPWHLVQVPALSCLPPVAQYCGRNLNHQTSKTTKTTTRTICTQPWLNIPMRSLRNRMQLARPADYSKCRASARARRRIRGAPLKCGGRRADTLHSRNGQVQGGTYERARPAGARPEADERRGARARSPLGRPAAAAAADSGGGHPRSRQPQAPAVAARPCAATCPANHPLISPTTRRTSPGFCCGGGGGEAQQLARTSSCG